MYNSDDIINGEYAVSRVFTNGGMGLVYKVHHLAWDMDLALKCPRKELLQTDEQKRSFTKECETWMDIGVHPNIVTCFYVKQIDSVPSVVMEYLDSGSLADYIDSGRLYNDAPINILERILDIGIQTARGLGYAQDKGYVHQDVKPANTLMSSSGVVKVSDFLSDYGLIPPETVLPNFRLECGFEYKIDQGTAYRLMNGLCEMFATRELKCIIRMPENSESDIERTNQGLLHQERANQALLDGNEMLSVIELSKSVGIGIMPDDALLDKRHKIVKRHSSCSLINAWQQGYNDKYWDGEALRLFSADGVTPDVATYGNHVCLDIGCGERPDITIVKCKKLNNGDILGIHYVTDEYGDRVIELCRYATESNPNVLKKRWGFIFPKSQYITATMTRMEITDCACCIVVDKDVCENIYVIDLGSGTILKQLPNLKSIQYSKIDFDSMSPLRFCVVNKSQFMAFDRDFNIIDGLSDWASGILGKHRIFDVSNDGTKILFDVGWGMEICDLVSRKIDVVLRYNRYPCFCHAIFSPCGGAIAIWKGTHLRIFDLKNKKTVFEYAVHDAEPIREMCFDKTGRFIYALYGHNKIETFQLYWDIEENGNEA